MKTLRVEVPYEEWRQRMGRLDGGCDGWLLRHRAAALEAAHGAGLLQPTEPYRLTLVLVDQEGHEVDAYGAPVSTADLSDTASRTPA